MGKAFKCDICGKYYDGIHPYTIDITDRGADPRDRKVDKTILACRECGKKFWDKVE